MNPSITFQNSRNHTELKTGNYARFALPLQPLSFMIYNFLFMIYQKHLKYNHKSQIINHKLKMPFPAPPVIVSHRKAVVRYLAESVVDSARKKHRWRVSAAFTLLGLYPLLWQRAPPLALPAICISVFHFYSLSYFIQIQQLAYLLHACTKPFNISRYNVCN